MKTEEEEEEGGKEGEGVEQLVCEIDIPFFPEYKVRVCQQDSDERRVFAAECACLETVLSDYTLQWLEEELCLPAASFLTADSDAFRNTWESVFRSLSFKSLQ